MSRPYNNLRERVNDWAVIVVPFALYFLTHTIIYRFGLFASGGYPIFLLPIAPMFAVLAAFGAEWAVAALRRVALPTAWGEFMFRFVCVWAVAGVVLAAAQSRPFTLDARGRAMQAAADWLEVREMDDGRTVMAENVMFSYFYDERRRVRRAWNTELTDLPPGTVAVWDDKYAEPQGLTREMLASWRELARFEGGAGVIYEKP
jgi:hypothetical protein